MAAFSYYTNRLITLPLTQEGKNKEWAEVPNMAKSNGIPENKITKIKNTTDHESRKDRTAYKPPKMGNLHTL